MDRIPVGIIGLGMVGGAYARWFESQGHPVARYDIAGVGSMEDVNAADVIFVAVPTPFDERLERFDGSAVGEAVGAVRGPKTIVIKSTVLPGTTEQLQAAHPEQRILFSPEFLTERTADLDVAHPRMNIVGYTAASRSGAPEVLGLLAPAPFERLMPSREAECFKYLRNAFFATKVVFFNQLYDLCDQLGLDYEAIRQCAAHDPWIGGQHTEVWHHGYRGYGGKCLPKDTRAFIRFSRQAGVDQKLLTTVEAINAALSAGVPSQAGKASAPRPGG